MKVGVVGCGMIARRVHLPIYQSIENVEIVGISDLKERTAQVYAKKFGVKKWFKDYQEMFKEDLDLISICTPNFTHAQITKDAAEAGINVLVEKPMASNLQEADEMIDACKRAGVKLCVVHNNRYIPSLQETKKRITNGRIGRIVSIQATKYHYTPMAWSHSSWFFYKWGLLEDMGYHIIDMVNYLCDSKLEDVKVVARDYVSEMECLNHIMLLMLYKNSASAFLDLSWVSGCLEASLKVQGTGGLLNTDLRNNHVQEIHGFMTPTEDLSSHFKKSFKTIKAALDKSYFKGALSYHKKIIEDYILSINTGTEIPIPGEQGREIMAIIDTIKSKINANELEANTTKNRN
jgi:UDP-N-acetylglucosamine 3-dehydrogenase